LSLCCVALRKANRKRIFQIMIIKVAFSKFQTLYNLQTAKLLMSQYWGGGGPKPAALILINFITL
jgi:hypothetical protein